MSIVIFVAIFLPLSALSEKFVNADDPAELVMRIRILSESLGIVPNDQRRNLALTLFSGSRWN